jgi:sugar lactone lactonase YvrE
MLRRHNTRSAICPGLCRSVLRAGLVLTLAAWRTAVVWGGEAATADPCAPSNGLQYICGPVASEDVAQVPGTRWLIASSLNLGQPDRFWLIDARSHLAAPLRVGGLAAPRHARAVQRASGCTGPPDPAGLSTDGLALGPGARGRHRLYAANHGDRNAIEVFELDARGLKPTLRWIDCAPMPPGTLPNAVTPLPDGGLLVVSFHDPNDPQAWARMARGEHTGRILAWHAGHGFHVLPGGTMSGGNGIALSPDGRWIYASAWSGRRLVVLSRHDGSRREIRLDFMPDNLHVLPDGTLLVGGQRATVDAVAACTGPHCPQPWLIARVNPRSGSVQTLLSGEGTAEVDYACGALLVEGTLFVTVRGDRRIAYRELPASALSSRR